ncbi:WD40-repeat-containing domain protein [Rhexocercosporidium sp. MPI-PUGE-AT-0058]|nr:WD40-repeat-containing domain protein [Rhexocercosporidium sp. MPI-PUGE-AT-0058]
MPPLTTQAIKSSHAVVTTLHTTPRNILVAFDDGIVNIFDLEGKNERVLMASERGGVWAMDTWFEEGREEEEWLAVGGTDCLVGVWSLRRLEKMSTLSGHQNTVRCIATLSATQVLSGSRDSTLRIWNINTSTCEAILDGHTKTIRHFAVKDNIAVSASYDSDARVWDLRTRKCVHVLRDHDEKVYVVKFDGRRIVTGSMDRTVRVWDPVSGTCRAVLRGHNSLVGLLELTNTSLITAGADGDIFSWSLDDYAEEWRVDAHGNAVTALHSNGQMIASGGSDGKVKVWNAQTGAVISELLDSDAVWQVAILGQKILVFFMKKNNVIMEFWAVPASS